MQKEALDRTLKAHLRESRLHELDSGGAESGGGSGSGDAATRALQQRVYELQRQLTEACMRESKASRELAQHERMRNK